MRLHFKESGNGQPLIILHGLFGSSDNWMAVAPKLAEHFRVFVIDLRNHGQSPHSAEMDYALMAGDVAEFLDVNNFADAALMGHSLGGKVAMQFALSYPNRVTKLIVSDMVPRVYEPSHAKIISALLALDLNAFQSRQPIEEALAAEIPSLAVRRFLLKNLGRICETRSVHPRRQIEVHHRSRRADDSTVVSERGDSNHRRRGALGSCGQAGGICRASAEFFADGLIENQTKEPLICANPR